MSRPKVNSEGQRQLDQAQEKFDDFQSQVKQFNPLDQKQSDSATEPQTKISNREARAADAPYIKPVRSINRSRGGKDGAKVYFDEKHRAIYEKDHEYVRCVVENYEIIGEAVEAWTCKWGCDPAEFWKIPVNKPIMIPRHLAEQLAKCKYHRLSMEDRPVQEMTNMTFTGAMVIDQVKHRINATPVGFGF